MLDDATQKAKNVATTGSERAVMDVIMIEFSLGHAERELERQNVLLQWVEQERRAMDPGHATSTDDSAIIQVSDAIRHSTILVGPKRHRALVDLPLRQSRLRRVSKPKRLANVSAKEKMPLRPHHPQRVTKANRVAGAGAKSLSRVQPCGIKQICSAARELSLID